MNHVEVRKFPPELRQRLNHCFVDGMRALTAASDEQCGTGFRDVGRYLEDLWSYRDTRYVRILEIFLRLGKLHGGSFHKFANVFVDHAGNRIGLESHRGNAANDGGDHGWTGCVSADADHDIGTEIADQC